VNGLETILQERLRLRRADAHQTKLVSRITCQSVTIDADATDQLRALV
jgi:hypothetical protein